MNSLLSRFLSQASNKFRFSLWLALISITLMTGFSLWQGGAKVQSDILAMLPKISESPMTQRAMAQVEQQLANRVYLGFVSDNQQAAIDAAKLTMKSLRQDSAPVAFVDISSADMAQAEALNSYYFKHRFQLLTEAQQDLLQQGQWQQLTQTALEKLYNAFSYANSSLLSHDPLLLYPDSLIALAPSQQLSVKQGVLLATIAPSASMPQPRFAAIVMAKGSDSAFNPNAQQRQLTALQTAFHSVNQQDAGIEIIKAGALFHAAAATENAKQEVSSIGLLSLIGVISLVWLAFRSFMPLTIAVITVSTSLLLAVVTTALLFGELHLLTLVFGTSLIGISIDYCFHYYCERLNHPSDSSETVIKKIFAAITLALVTSVIAYSAIGLAPFPGMQQVAVFCASGLVGAYLTLLLAYPTLAARPLKEANTALNLASQYQAFMLNRALPKKPVARLLLVICSIGFIGIGISQLTANDDIRQLQHTPSDIQAEEDQLRTLLSGGTDNQFLLVTAATQEQLKQQLEAVEPILELAEQDKILGNHLSLSRFLPSQQAQERNYQLQGQIYLEHLDEIIATLGLEPNIKASLIAEYRAANSKFITADSFLSHQAGANFKPLWLSPQLSPQSGADQGYGAIVLLGGITQLDALAQLFTGNSQVQLVDKVGDISTVMGHYRQLTLALLALALLVAGIIFTFRFGAKLAAIVVAVPALSALLTLACLGIMHNPLTLFHALSLILVFGIGVDYSLFFAESKQQTRGVMMAVFMSAVSTLLAFGLLAFSQTPAINAFGLTLLLGISFTFLLSPFIQIFTRKSVNAD
ncbi:MULTISPECIES: MMPL family transporter [unclassified Shewanella]|uniref:MMPL family transporter n=1 Tax=unclassified Shewanella TaxID=196818 RepID=UPI001BC7417C|nr:MULTISPECIES: MMPL family transporter [unclassified Shewanella]GIU11349.1 MMPL family efflux pump permease component [Shewanella sp. MBTL60-112-B1]GIU31058.1 MMPL family efflux pump permease component [Shewanella sp. MBTL60-112-B2]